MVLLDTDGRVTKRPADKLEEQSQLIASLRDRNAEMTKTLLRTQAERDLWIESRISEGDPPPIRVPSVAVAESLLMAAERFCGPQAQQYAKHLRDVALADEARRDMCRRVAEQKP